MEYDAHIEAIEREAGLLVAALDAAGTGATVPSCPEWTTRDLAEHVGSSTAFWCDVLRDALGQPKTGEVTVPDDAELVAWVAEELGSLVALLRATTADTPCWSWIEDQQHVAFVARRWANEMAVHRIDAQLAAGAPTPVDAPLAVDGIEEMFTMAEAYAATRAELDPSRAEADPGPADGSSASLHLHATDVDPGGEWLVAMGPDDFDVTRAHTKGDCAVQATASDLLLTMYQRPTQGGVTTFGDPAVLTRWYGFFTFG